MSQTKVTYDFAKHQSESFVLLGGILVSENYSSVFQNFWW